MTNKNKVAASLLGANSLNFQSGSLFTSRKELRDILLILEDIQAETIKNKSINLKPYPLRLINFNLNKKDLYGLNLDESFFKDGSFNQANFFLNSNKLYYLSLYSTSFKNSHFQNIGLNQANLKGVSFRGAVLEQLNADQSILDHTDFTNSLISDSNFSQSQLIKTKFDQTVFQGVVDFSRSALEEVSFINTNLARVFLGMGSLIGVRIHNTNLDNVNLKGSAINYLKISSDKEIQCQQADFSNVDAKEIIFKNKANFTRSRFDRGTIAHSRFLNSNFKDTSFKDAQFFHCIFDQSTFHQADFENAEFYGCWFLNTDLENEVLNINQAKFQNCIFEKVLSANS